MYVFLLFMIYSFVGWCFECVHMAITTKEVVNRGFLNGPFIPVYGVGLTLITLLLGRFKSNFLVLLVLSILVIGVVEYLAGYFLEKIFKIRWWDYSNRKFNLHGRVCLNTMIIFITGAMLIIYFLHPIIMNILGFLSFNTTLWLCIILLIILFGDLILSIMFTLNFLKSKSISNKLDKTPEIKKYIWKKISKKM